MDFSLLEKSFLCLHLCVCVLGRGHLLNFNKIKCF